MILEKKPKIKKHAKNLDKLVTWMIIGWAIASVIWLSKTNKWKKVTKEVVKEWTNIARKWYSIFWKILISFFKIISPKSSKKN